MGVKQFLAGELFQTTCLLLFLFAAKFNKAYTAQDLITLLVI